MAIVHGDIGGAEPSTVTFRVDTVTINQNSTVVHREVLVLGDPQSSIAYAVVKAAPPVSTEFGSVVRIASGPSSAADLLMTASQGTNPWTIAGNSTIVFLPAYLSTAVGPPSNSTALNVRIVGGVSSAVDFPVRAVLSATAADNPVLVSGNSTVVIASGNSSVIVTSGNSSVIVTSGNSSVIVTSGNLTSTCVQGTNPWIIAGNSTVVQAAASNPWITATVMQSSVAPSSNSSGAIVRVVVDNILTTASSNAFASTSLVIQSSGAGLRSYVTAYTITSTVQAPTAVKFYTSGTMIWPIVLAALSSAVTGVNLAVSAPAYLFRTASQEALTLQTASSVAGFKVAVSYFRAP